MKIAAVSFHWMKNQVGGAQVPAAAFRDWMLELGQECDLLAFTTLGKSSVNFSNPGKLITYRLRDYFNVLNSYDFIYFATPGIMKDPDNYNKFFSQLSKSFAVHLHGEYDSKLYNNLNKIIESSFCKMLYVVSPEAKKNWDFDVQKSIFYPCTLPDYLLKEKDTWDTSNRKGLLYAARLTTIKHPKILASFSKDEAFREECRGPIDVYGISPIYAIEQEIKNINPIWNRFPLFYDVYDIKATKELFSQYRFYWDVFGNKKYTHYFRRFNLSAAEAVSCGVIPIVYESMCPLWIFDLAPKVDFKNPDINLIIRELAGTNVDYDHVIESMRNSLLESPYAYSFVKEKVRLSLEVAL